MFASLLAEVTDQDRQFTVYRSGAETDIASQFENHAVSVTHRELPPDGPEPFLVIEDDDEFAGALSVAELERFLEPPIVRPGTRGDTPEGFGVLFEILDETLFSSMNRRQLLAVSREIEDRALRVGHGTLRACFQSNAAFDPQKQLYRQLAAETELDIHVYAVEDRSVPGITFHRGTAVGQYWILAFDGGSDSSQACALVARHTADGFEGFWTYDSDLVDDILAALAE